MNQKMLRSDTTVRSVGGMRSRASSIVEVMTCLAMKGVNVCFESRQRTSGHLEDVS
jgi:hypothetical protein